MSEVPETGSVWCENSVVGVKTHFHVNLTCFHAKSTRIHTKVWCELNPCFSLMNVDSRQRAEHATLNCSHVNAEGRAGQHAYHMLSLDLSLDCSDLCHLHSRLARRLQYQNQ